MGLILSHGAGWGELGQILKRVSMIEAQERSYGIWWKRRQNNIFDGEAFVLSRLNVNFTYFFGKE